MKFTLEFENGDVLITPGMSMTSTAIVEASNGVGGGVMGNINNS